MPTFQCPAAIARCGALGLIVFASASLALYDRRSAAAPPSASDSTEAADRSKWDSQKSDRPWRADAGLVERLANQRGQFRYRESEVPAYELPNVFGPGEQPGPQEWPERRAQIVDHFRTHVYGHRPRIEAKIRYRVAQPPVDPTGGRAEGRQVVCALSQGDRSFEFPFLIYTPAASDATEATGIPLVVFINNRERPDPAAMAETPNDFWPLDLIIGAGYATAVIYTSDVDPDRADGYAEGVRGFLADGQPRAPDAWGALSAWGWGASRVLDYAIEELPQIDPARVAVVGHSRGGKSALWAAVEDPRFAIAYSNNSGCGGAALSRRRFGETVARITTSFPHWFCENFSTYGDHEDRLPVDQHQLIASIAPRAVYVASAGDDLWADPRGEYLSVVEAAPIFELLGEESISEREMPPLDSQRIVGKTGYHIRPGQHGLTRDDWQRFLDFADRQAMAP